MMRILTCLVAVFLATAPSAEDLVPYTASDPIYPSIEDGAVRSFAQYEWDGTAHRIVRRSYSVFDPLAGDELALRWVGPANGADGPLNTDGTLIWSTGGTDAEVVARFEGRFRNGAATGYGDFHHVSGLRYQGAFRNGVMHGHGFLHLPDGTQYVGGFRNGREDGTGLLTDVFGNVLDGSFVMGLADGPGTRFPKHDRAYGAIWRDGTELPGSRVPIDGPEGTEHIVPAAGQIYPDVDVGISVSQPLTNDFGEPAFLPYTVARTPEMAQIQPDDPRLLGVWLRGEDIKQKRFGALTQSFSGNRERYGPVPIVISIANRRPTPLRVLGAYLDMQSSESERRPALMLNYAADAFCGSGVATDFKIRNYGWATADNARAQLLFVAPDGRPISGSFTAELGNFGQDVDVDFAQVFRTLGVAVDDLKANPFQCAQGEDCLSKALATGKFGTLAAGIKRNGLSLEVAAEGSVTYSWQTARGETRQGQSEFGLEFNIGKIFSLAECGGGAPVQPIMSNILTLPADSGPQPIPLAVTQDIPAGTVARLSLNLAATMSSYHRFQVVLQLSDGRAAASQPINMLYFTPNHWDPS